MMTPYTPLSGLIAATYTPFNDDGSLAPEQIPPMLSSLITQGVQGVYVCGSTGEGMSQTSAEREQVVEASVAGAAGKIPVIVQVGHNSLAEAQRLAAHAQSAGADAVSAVCPSYYPINGMDVLVDVMAEIAGAAPDKPFYYYHIPALSGVGLDMVDFLHRAGKSIPNLAGIKYTAPTLHEYQACREFEGGRYDMLWGVDEMALGAWYTGARGGVGSTYNVAAPIYRRLLRACEEGDQATALDRQSRSVNMIRTIARYPFHPAMKALLQIVGHDMGPTRLPMRPLTETQKSGLHTDLKELGFFDWLAEDVAALHGPGVLV